MKIGDRAHLTVENIFEIFSGLEKRGFDRYTLEEIRMSIAKKGSVSFLKKKHQGMERGYCFTHIQKNSRKKRIFVWTTWVDKIQDINKEDFIWILIEDDGSPIIIYLFPIKRTLNFVKNTLDHIDMAIEFVQTWPRCPECGDELRLEFVNGIWNLMKFVCGNNGFVHSPNANRFYPLFDIPISDKNSEILYADFKRNLEYQHKNSLKEHPAKPARLSRAERKQQAMLTQHQKTNQYGDIRTYQEGVDGPHNDGEYGD